MRRFFVLLAMVMLTGCSGYNDYWTAQAGIGRAKADIQRAKAARVREDTRHREEMHYIHEANTAKAGPVLAYAFTALVIGGVVLTLVYTGGQATAAVITAHAAARDVRPDPRGFLPVHSRVIVDTRPRIRLLGARSNWQTVEEITNHRTGEVRDRHTVYDARTGRVFTWSETVTEPQLLTADAQHRILALIGCTLQEIAKEGGDPRLAHALDTLRTQIQGLPGMSTPALPGGKA